MNINQIKHKSIRYTYNTLVIKVKIDIIEDQVVFSIGLHNPNGKFRYENWFTKMALIDEDGSVNIENKFIENPPFNFYKRFLLKDLSLKDFFDTMESKIINATRNENFSINNNGNNETLKRLYTQCFVKNGVGPSKDTIDVIKHRFPNKYADELISYCCKKKSTVRFVDEIEKMRILRFDE
jgi:hypothetical protein